MSLRERKSSVVKGAQVSLEKVKSEFQKNPKLRNDFKVGGLGLLLGVILGGLLAHTEVVPLPSLPGGNGRSVPWRSLKARGWNPVHVFYGKMNHFYEEIPEKWYLKGSKKHTQDVSKEWFGQHGQDVAVAKFLGMKNRGYFVDLASNDAVWASNTFALEHNFDWKGICIEANPVYWYRLAFRKNCHVVGTIVGGSDFDDIKVNLPNNAKERGPFGGIVGQQFDNKKTKDEEPRYTVSLVNILKKFNAPKTIDYLSLDVEGAEEFIMKGFPFNSYTFRTITIERPKPMLKKKLEEAGYKHVLDFKRGDTLWAHKSEYRAGKKRVENLDEAIKTHILDDYPNKKKRIR